MSSRGPSDEELPHLSRGSIDDPRLRSSTPVLDWVLASQGSGASPHPPDLGIRLGLVESVQEDGQVRVRGWDSNVEWTAVWSLVAVGDEHVGRIAVLLLLPGGPGMAVLIGVVQPPLSGAVPTGTSRSDDVEARVDGRRIEFAATEQVVLRCGKASITLTRSGKVLVKGEYVLTHAKGTHRIRGGTVQIN